MVEPLNSDFKTTLRCSLYVYVSGPIVHIGDVIQTKQAALVYLGIYIYLHVYGERAKGNAWEGLEEGKGKAV